MTKPKWRTLRHAQGTATKVPKWIEALSGDEAEEAVDELRSALVAPGQWFSASPPTIAALMQVGTPVAWRLATECLSSDPLQALAGKVDLASQADPHFKECQAQAAAHGDLLRAALESKDAEVASSAAGLASFLPDLDLDGALERLLRSKRTQAEVASALLALSLRAKLRSKPLPPSVARYAATEPSRTIYHGAATLLHQLPEPAAQSSLFQALSTSAGQPSWMGADAFSVVAACAAGRSAEDHKALAHSLANALRDAPQATRVEPTRVEATRVEPTRVEGAREEGAGVEGPALSVEARKGGPLLALAWAGVAVDLQIRQSEPRYELLSADGLSPDQREVVSAMSTRHGLNLVGSGIPHGLVERRRWLGLDEASPLEQELTYEGDDIPVWRAWRAIKRDQKSAQQIPEVLAERFSKEDQLRMLVEVGLDAYGLYYAGKPYPDAAAYDALLAEVDLNVAATWARALADDLGPMVRDGLEDHTCMARPEPYHALLLVLTRAGVAFEPEWDSLVSHIGGHAEELHLALPAERREQLVYSRLVADEQAGNRPMRSLVSLAVRLSPSYRVIKIVLEMAEHHRQRYAAGRIRTEMESHIEQIRALASSSPEIERALAEVSIGE